MVNRVSSRLHDLPLIPLLCGDNPMNQNVFPRNFLRLTDLWSSLILKQWAKDKLMIEIKQGWLDEKTCDPLPALSDPHARPRTD